MQTNNPVQEDQVRQQVRERYGAIAMAEPSCCAPGCCSPNPAATAPETLGYEAGDAESVPEGAEMGLGCGNPTAIASIRPGETVVDLGSGGGFDCFLAAKQTGPGGLVIGVDMTPEMITKARANAAKAGAAHVQFRLGEIEQLPVADHTADLIISNCVINLSPNKPQVLSEIFRVLKPGGRVAISDIVATAQIPDDLRKDFMAYTGCVGGASSVHEMEGWLAERGFVNVKIAVKESSRQFIDEWVPGKNPGRYVASAIIEARKPFSSPGQAGVAFTETESNAMTVAELKTHLRQHPGAVLRFLLPDGGLVPAHAHVTEVGRVEKTFVDCGGKVRRDSACRLQTWVADDIEHRLPPEKLADILDRASGLLGSDMLPVEVEYEDGFVSQFPVAAAEFREGNLMVALGVKHTDCLAKDICLPSASAGNEGGCCSGGGCC